MFFFFSFFFLHEGYLGQGGYATIFLGWMIVFLLGWFWP